jgi:hypothetical protein
MNTLAPIVLLIFIVGIGAPTFRTDECFVFGAGRRSCWVNRPETSSAGIVLREVRDTPLTLNFRPQTQTQFQAEYRPSFAARDTTVRQSNIRPVSFRVQRIIYPEMH